jgi:hypothetical protein
MSEPLDVRVGDVPDGKLTLDENENVHWGTYAVAVRRPPSAGLVGG